MKCPAQDPAYQRLLACLASALLFLALILILPRAALAREAAPKGPAAEQPAMGGAPGAGEQVGKGHYRPMSPAELPGRKAQAAPGAEHEGQAETHQWKPPLWSVGGFVIMLLCIAIIPLAEPHWWEHNQNKGIVTAILGIPVGIYVVSHDGMALIHSLHEYEQFLILLLSLFAISGGIWLSGDVRATPKNNTTFLTIGAVLASFIGTTGAAMLLIRPVLSSNSERRYVMHTVIFFIFLVANIGGSLTPLGDPPLFLGYLRGVPFTWTFRLWHLWLPTCAFLLVLYFAIDTYFWRKESEAAKEWDAEAIQPLKLKGAINFLFLLGVVLSIYFYPDMAELMKEHLHLEESVVEWIPVREAIMLLLTYVSWKVTKIEYRKAQNFTWNPIIEVAVLFLGIFITMIPALILLNIWGPTAPCRSRGTSSGPPASSRASWTTPPPTSPICPWAWDSRCRRAWPRSPCTPAKSSRFPS